MHGRPVSNDEVHNTLQPYFRRHIVIHKWHRFVDRLPLPRRAVVTVPVEPGLRESAPSPVVPALDDNAADLVSAGPSALLQAHGIPDDQLAQPGQIEA